jgi:hypothetical protein
LCEGNGAPNVFEKKGKFQCARRKAGWDGIKPPDAGAGIKVAVAFEVTDATGKADQKSYYWPAGARIDSPKTWGAAVGE